MNSKLASFISRHRGRFVLYGSLVLVTGGAFLMNTANCFTRQRDPIAWACAQHDIAAELYDQDKYRQAFEVLRPVVEIRRSILTHWKAATSWLLRCMP